MPPNPSSSFPQFSAGFDFLQDMVRNAGSVLPGIGQWVAPTLDPAELEKRINDLRTVQFWLEQNARMLATTIQALEVQRMTLTTLKTMNVQMDDLRESLTIRPDASGRAVPPEPEEKEVARANDEARRSNLHPAHEQPSPQPQRAIPSQPMPGQGGLQQPPGMVDPMQWWGALTKEFATLAAHAMRDGAAEAARSAVAGAAATPQARAPRAEPEPPRRPDPTAKPKPKAPARKTAARKKAAAKPSRQNPTNGH